MLKLLTRKNESMRPTEEVIRSAVIRPPVDQAEAKHRARVAAAFGVQVSTERLSPVANAALTEAKLTLLVKPSVVAAFKYAAQVGPWNLSRSFGVMTENDESVLYGGDIPEFALDRLDALRRIGPDWPLTIHSNLPLPVQVSEALPRVDPVLIAWPHLPRRITVDRSGRLLRDTGFGKRDEWLRDNDPGGAGIVVAMWDMDKEVTLWWSG